MTNIKSAPADECDEACFANVPNEPQLMQRIDGPLLVKIKQGSVATIAPNDVADDWPPLGFQNRYAPRDDSLRSLVRWLSLKIQQLNATDWLNREGHFLATAPLAGSTLVADGARIAEHLREGGLSGAPHMPTGDVTAKQAHDYLQELRERIERGESDKSLPNPSIADSDSEASKLSVERRMVLALHYDPEREQWSQRQWARHLGCSATMIGNTSVWKTIMKNRGLAKQFQEKQAIDPFED